MQKSKEKDLYQAEHKLCKISGEMKYQLIRFGDYIAKREKYKEHKGIDAIHFYLIEKYHWLPSQVKSLNDDDLRFVLSEEMHGWTLPKDTIF
jgi:hypothetical protein